MIVGKQKPIQELWDMIQGYRRVLVFGCNTCVAVCHQGGNKEAEILASLLRLQAARENRDIRIEHGGIERQCEHEFFQSAEAAISGTEAVLSLACGVGVQFIAARYPGKIALPGLNTLFMGDVPADGLWTEACQGCGQCILHLTAGICPIARCAKRLMNGPCGGSTQGKCEISQDTDCAWQLIVDRLGALGRLDDYEKVIPIKDWSSERAGGPRKMIRDKEAS